MSRPSTADRARPLGPLTRIVDATAGNASMLVFGAASLVRRSRIFHPRGVAFDATLDVAESDLTLGARLFDEPGRRRCIVRLSRGVGLPPTFPDVLGLAVRVLDAYGDDECQDFLLVTAGEAPVARSALLPARGYADRRYSSLVPYRVGDRTLLVGARPLLTEGESPVTFDALASAAADARLRFSLDVAEPLGAWEPVATLEIGQRLGPLESQSLRFNVFNTGGGIEPVGFLNTLRRKAYAGSQAVRPTPLEQRA